MILDDRDDVLRRFVAGLVGNKAGIDSMFDQLFSHAPIDRINPLDAASFDSPLPLELLMEFLDDALVRQSVLLLEPDPPKGHQLIVSEQIGRASCRERV